MVSEEEVSVVMVSDLVADGTFVKTVEYAPSSTSLTLVINQWRPGWGISVLRSEAMKGGFPG